MIPSLRLGISEGVTHAAVSLDEGCVALKHQRPGRKVGIVPATVADGARIFHHGHAEARLDRLCTGGVNVIHGEAVERVAFITPASDRQGYEQQVRLRQIAECQVILLRRAGRPLILKGVALQDRGVVEIGNVKQRDLESGDPSRFLVRLAADGEEAIVAEDGMKVGGEPANLELL